MNTTKEEEYRELRAMMERLRFDSVACTYYDENESVNDVHLNKIETSLAMYKRLKRIDYSARVSELYNEYYLAVGNLVDEYKEKTGKIKNFKIFNKEYMEKIREKYFELASYTIVENNVDTPNKAMLMLDEYDMMDEFDKIKKTIV